MNSAERKAMNEGLRHTGVYESDYPRSSVESDYVGKAKREAKRIRDLGFRAIVVRGDNGKSTYAEQAYFTNRSVEECKRELQGMDNRRNYAKLEYEKELSKIQEREDYLLNFIKENER